MYRPYTVKSLMIFPSLSAMSLTKLFLAGRVLVSDIPAGNGKIVNRFFYSLSVRRGTSFHSLIFYDRRTRMVAVPAPVLRSPWPNLNPRQVEEWRGTYKLAQGEII
jgi:hypothetical protein